MRRDLNLADLHLVYLPGSHVPMNHWKQYNLAYDLWRNVWVSYFSSLPNPIELWADHFSRQDEVGALFCGDKCVALTLFRWLNLATTDLRRDSFFRKWRETDVERIVASQRSLCLPSFLTVHRDFRRDKTPIDIRRLMLGLLVRRFIDSSAEGLVATTRNQKGINDILYSFGAVPIQKNVPHFHKEDLVDHLTMNRDNLKKFWMSDIVPLVATIWERREMVGSDPSLRWTSKSIADAG